MDTPRRLILLICLSAAYLTGSGQSAGRPVNADSLLQRLERQLYAIDPEQGDRIPVYFVMLDDLRASLDRVAEQVIGRPETDPVVLRLKQARHRFDSLSPVIAGKMQRIDLVLFEEGSKAKNAGDTARAAAMYLKSLRHNPRYGPSAFELVHLYLTPSGALDAADYMAGHAAAMDSADNPYYFSQKCRLAGRIIDALIARSDRLVHDDLPADALGVLREAVRFHNRFSQPGDREKIEQATERAHRGMYHSLLNIAARADAQHKWDLAEYYVGKARQYQEEHELYLKDDPAWIKVSEQVAMNREKAFLLKEKPEKTRKSHTAGKKRKSRRPSRKPAVVKTRKATREPAPQDTLVPYYLRMSAQHALQQDRETALCYCDSARMKQEKLPLHPDSLIRKCVEDAALKPLLDTLHQTYYTVWRNDLNQARAVLAHGRSMQQRYFRGHEALAATLAELEKRLYEKTCFNASAAFEAMIYRAISRFSGGAFLEGRDFLDKAAAIAEGSPDCPLADSLLGTLREKYRGAVAWQQHWNEARRASVLKDYALFVREYLLAWQVYRGNSLSGQGIPFRELTEYIENQRDPAFSLGCAMPFIEAGDAGTAWTLLQQAHSLRPAADLLQPALSGLGRLMYLEDRKIGDSRWLSALKSAGNWARPAKKSYLRSGNKNNRP